MTEHPPSLTLLQFRVVNNTKMAAMQTYGPEIVYEVESFARSNKKLS